MALGDSGSPFALALRATVTSRPVQSRSRPLVTGARWRRTSPQAKAQFVYGIGAYESRSAVGLRRDGGS